MAVMQFFTVILLPLFSVLEKVSVNCTEGVIVFEAFSLSAVI